jgi:hypothetical protein
VVPFKNHPAKTVWRAPAKKSACKSSCSGFLFPPPANSPTLQSCRPNKSLPPPTNKVLPPPMNKALQHVCNSTSGACPSHRQHKTVAADLPSRRVPPLLQPPSTTSALAAGRSREQTIPSWSIVTKPRLRLPPGTPLLLPAGC